MMRNRHTAAMMTESHVPTRRAVLLASLRGEDLLRIPALLNGTSWMVIKATAWNEVLQLSRAVVFPVMLCDRELQDLDWPRGLKELCRNPKAPELIVLADVCSGALSTDIACIGGFDLIFRPVASDKLLLALDSALLSWEKRLRGTARAAV